MSLSCGKRCKELTICLCFRRKPCLICFSVGNWVLIKNKDMPKLPLTAKRSRKSSTLQLCKTSSCAKRKCDATVVQNENATLQLPTTKKISSPEFLDRSPGRVADDGGPEMSERIPGDGRRVCTPHNHISEQLLKKAFSDGEHTSVNNCPH